MPQPIDPSISNTTASVALRSAVLTALPTTEQAVHTLRDLVDFGLPGYTEPSDDPFTIPEELDDALCAEVIGWEERHQRRAQLWAEDRFRLGFALGSGVYAHLLLVVQP